MWKKIKRFILPAIILVAIIVFLIVKFYIFKESATSVSSRSAEFKMGAPELLMSFEKDENASNLKYNNKVLLVTGMVDKVTEAEANYTVYLKNQGSTAGVLCSFDKKEFQKNPLRSGDLASIKGICNGYLEDVILNKCAVEK
jgi:hypothetical protein